MPKPRSDTSRKNLISENLIELRHRHNLSQRDLAQKLQIAGCDMDKKRHNQSRNTEKGFLRLSSSNGVISSFNSLGIKPSFLQISLYFLSLVISFSLMASQSFYLFFTGVNIFGPLLDTAAKLFLVFVHPTSFGIPTKFFREMVITCAHQTKVGIAIQGFGAYNLRSSEFAALQSSSDASVQ